MDYLKKSNSKKISDVKRVEIQEEPGIILPDINVKSNLRKTFAIIPEP